ncbi:hypothetical protein [Blastococcus sp. TF02-09]|uniref:hypothetical protein n=1 Tax=Blastococcus sp. TF02-09 TaxID=2250576 RepID=UPI0011BF9B72|nr:hypothetical protein [Blastococcus sp. TF02-9]
MASSTSTAMRAASPARRRPARRPSTRRGTGGRRGKKDNWWPLVIVAAVVLLGVAWARAADDVPAVVCTVEGPVGTGSVRLTPDQAQNAATIARVGRERGLPDRAIVIALATAMQESTLRNLDHGDRDSLGLFQQRPSQGWGTPAQVQDPVHAAGIFYDRLVQVPNWETRSVVDASDRVQRSAYPERVGQWEPMAKELTAALSANALGCA